MSILKKSFQINFTQVPNIIINDKKVSLKAKGLYLYMVSKPDNWEFSLNGMESQLKESRTAIVRIIDELIICGYMDKIKNRINGKQATNDYILHLEPQIRSEYQNVTQKMRLTKCDSQNDTTSNTNTSNTKKSNTNSTKGERISFSSFRERYISKNIGEPFKLAECKPWSSDTPFVIIAWNDGEAVEIFNFHLYFEPFNI